MELNGNQQDMKKRKFKKGDGIEWKLTTNKKESFKKGDEIEWKLTTNKKRKLKKKVKELNGN